MLAIFVGIVLFIGYAVMLLALALQYRIARAAQRHNRELRDRINNQADVIGQKDAINESLRLALISRGGLVAVDEWPDEIYR